MVGVQGSEKGSGVYGSVLKGREKRCKLNILPKLDLKKSPNHYDKSAVKNI